MSRGPRFDPMQSESAGEPATALEDRVGELERELKVLRTRHMAGWPTRLLALLFLAGLALATGIGVHWRVSAQGGGGSPAPGVLNYQGQLTDAGGNPLSGNYDVTFRLYNVSGGGTALWTEAHAGANAVVVSSGLFSTLLGSIDPIPGEVMASSPLYLGLAVGADAEMTPRQPVTSVAYALVANDVADGAITSQKLADGAITASKLASGAVTTDKIALNAVSKVVFTDLWFAGAAGFSAPGDNAFHRIGLTGSFTTTGGDLFIVGAPTHLTAAACSNFVSVALDGESVDTNNPPVMAICDNGCTGFRYVPSFPAGNHTIQAVVKNNCATVTVAPDSTWPIAVLELKR